jgi:hypothetical protein
MRTVKGSTFLSGLCGFAAVLGVVTADARADVTIEKGASIVVFPKILVGETYDTIIQLASTRNSMVHVLCYYVNAAHFDTITGQRCFRPSATCAPLWQETDFHLWLTKQQPTMWQASRGRRVDPTDGFGNYGSGFDPGLIPPLFEFEGELKCIQVTETGEPFTGNNLKGEVTIKARGNGVLNGVGFIGDVSKYNAIGIVGNPDVQPFNPLLLDGQEYEACPEKLILNHFATLAKDPVVQGLDDRINGNLSLDSAVFTELTLVPCSQDYENQLPTSSKIQFVVYNEFEERFSASTTVTCYLNVELTDIDSPTSFDRSVFSANVLGSAVAHAEIVPVENVDGTTRGVIGIAERFVGAALFDSDVLEDVAFASAAYNLHTKGNLIPDAGGPDRIRLTEFE